MDNFKQMTLLIYLEKKSAAQIISDAHECASLPERSTCPKQIFAQEQLLQLSPTFPSPHAGGGQEVPTGAVPTGCSHPAGPEPPHRATTSTRGTLGAPARCPQYNGNPVFGNVRTSGTLSFYS